MARAEGDPLVATWAERAIWAEAAPFLGIDDSDYRAPPPISFERAVRRLRLEGYSSCPKCLSALPTDADLARWSRLRTARAEQAEVHKRAVRPT